jgi:hypothetical protein
MSIDVANSGFCGAMSLGHPSSCGSDPVVQQDVHRAELEAKKQAALDTARGMTPMSTVDARLERFSNVDVTVPANTCHALVWTLAPDAKPGDVAISLSFETSRSSSGGLTGFNTDTRVGTSGVLCSSEAGRERFRVVDRFSRVPTKSAGTGGISFVLYARPRSATDPDSSEFSNRTPPGSVGVNCEECRFPCETDKRACDGDCFRSGLNPSERKMCERTCEQILRSCLRGCPGCW